MTAWPRIRPCSSPATASARRSPPRSAASSTRRARPSSGSSCRAGLAAIEQRPGRPAPRDPRRHHAPQGRAQRARAPRRSARASTPSTCTLRKKLDLYAAVRPVRSLDGVQDPLPRTSTWSSSARTPRASTRGIENEVVPGRRDQPSRSPPRRRCTRIARWAFRYAQHRGPQEDHASSTRPTS